MSNSGSDGGWEVTRRTEGGRRWEGGMDRRRDLRWTNQKRHQVCREKYAKGPNEMGLGRSRTQVRERESPSLSCQSYDLTLDSSGRLEQGGPKNPRRSETRTLIGLLFSFCPTSSRMFEDEEMLQRVPKCFYIIGGVLAGLQLIGVTFVRARPDKEVSCCLSQTYLQMNK